LTSIETPAVKTAQKIPGAEADPGNLA
jgi:hypothetical protein